MLETILLTSCEVAVVMLGAVLAAAVGWGVGMWLADKAYRFRRLVLTLREEERQEELWRIQHPAEKERVA
jgi:hypothetical protein